MSILEKVLTRSLMVAAVMAALAVSAGPVLAQAPIGRVATGIQVLYTFADDGDSDAVVPDISGVGTALDLTIEDPANASETPEGGLLIGPTTRLSNGTNDSKVYTECTAANALTVEAWLVPDNTSQSGPARIVTQSLDGGNRNFTLAQDAGVYEARLRTTTNGNNGTLVRLVGASATTDLQHVVFTRDAAGNATLYIDGVVAASDMIFGDFSNWNSTYDFGLANEFTAASTNTARDFLGEYRLVAVYCRALDVLEVLQNFDAGPDGLECEVDADCDDGLICTGEEFCFGGACEAGTPVVCDPDFFCSEASGGVCEPLLDPPDDPAEHLPLGCVDGQVAKYNTTTSLWECSEDIDTNTNAGTICAPGQYLDGDGTCKTPGPGLPTTCSDGQVAQWNGAEWVCAPDPMTAEIKAAICALYGDSMSVLDQENASSGFGAGDTDQWQSFTAGLSGFLSSVDLGVDSGLTGMDQAGTIRIYEGEGTAGALLTTQSVTFVHNPGGLQSFPFDDPPPVTAGQQYTIRFDIPLINVGWVELDIFNPYAGGKMSFDANWDMLFRTYVSALPAFCPPPTVSCPCWTEAEINQVGDSATACFRDPSNTLIINNDAGTPYAQSLDQPGLLVCRLFIDGLQELPTTQEENASCLAAIENECDAQGL